MNIGALADFDFKFTYTFPFILFRGRQGIFTPTLIPAAINVDIHLYICILTYCFGSNTPKTLWEFSNCD